MTVHYCTVLAGHGVLMPVMFLIPQEHECTRGPLLQYIQYQLVTGISEREGGCESPSDQLHCARKVGYDDDNDARDDVERTRLPDGVFFCFQLKRPLGICSVRDLTLAQSSTFNTHRR